MSDSRLTIHPKVLNRWARYCIENGIDLFVYARGYELLQSPEGGELLALGLDAVLDRAVKTVEHRR